ncbi:GlcG/HbpS family heme-binding protein [Marinomonas transparens]|uniref:Heme-binding protein n=1 Tax=Marinomonas transparens TaxID=2795388 RepID=A0A934JRZ0_9GAMM|nr:heme-binding protein [Marinomonas transparens]MBJ7539608.1 heme-binding protein [Marinomonas transparens]
MTSIIQTQELSYEAAIKMCVAVTQHAHQLGVSVGVVVVTPAGVELASVRMNNAPLHALSIARKKAYTAASFKIPSFNWQERLKHKPDTMSALLREENFTYLGGGIPIIVEGKLFGSIGVSGATEAQDIECAEHAITEQLNSL